MTSFNTQERSTRVFSFSLVFFFSVSAPTTCAIDMLGFRCGVYACSIHFSLLMFNVLKVDFGRVKKN